MKPDFLKPLFPIVCLSCGINSLEYLCPDCRNKIQNTLIPNHFFISNMGEMIYGYCRYSGASSAIIRSLKYGRKFPAAKVIAEFLAIILPIFNFLKPDRIIPVPISWQKQYHRGFNQCDLIASELGKITKIPIENKTLFRRFSFFEKDQVKLNAVERKKNLENSFFANYKKSMAKQKTILLLDDVATTGKTMYACHKALRIIYPEWKILSLVFAHN